MRASSSFYRAAATAARVPSDCHTPPLTSLPVGALSTSSSSHIHPRSRYTLGERDEDTDFDVDDDDNFPPVKPKQKRKSRMRVKQFSQIKLYKRGSRQQRQRNR